MESKPKNDQNFWNSFFSVVFLIIMATVIKYLSSIGQDLKNVSLFDYFLISMAAFRLIRLFVYDDVMEFIHKYLRKFPTGSRRTLRDLLNCPWCTGMWAALFVATIYFVFPVARFFIFVLALAGTGTYLQLIIWKIEEEKTIKITESSGKK